MRLTIKEVIQHMASGAVLYRASIRSPTQYTLYASDMRSESIGFVSEQSVARMIATSMINGAPFPGARFGEIEYRATPYGKRVANPAFKHSLTLAR